MKSRTTSQFWKHFEGLTPEVQRRAEKAYALWTVYPNAHSLYFKPVNTQQSIYSVRIGRGYRALGLLRGDTVVWFWIGTHDEYERLLKEF